MRHVWRLLCLLCISAVAGAQPLRRADAPVEPIPGTYAIVIGISDYKDPDIPKLAFSNRDAEVFAGFLMSAPGGSVPKQNIKLLTDSMATIGEVDKSIRWLMDHCKEGDRVFFYFSGHGEMENVTMSKNGYLICYNTPAVAFTHMGLSIDYLNDVVNTISVQTKAKVIVITDACHSGTMAGSKFKGNFFVGEQLMLKKENEIRMASCKPDELSNENVDWGGGRGVFSYYLVNGLQGGLADHNKDNTVSVGELKSYLESSMAVDPILKIEGDVQTPVIKGNEDFILSAVVEEEAAKIKEQVRNDSAMQVMMMSVMPGAGAEEPMEPADQFFSLLKKKPLEAMTDSIKLQALPAGEIALALIAQLGRDSIAETARNKLAELAIELKRDKEKADRFNLDLAGAFLDAGQAVIANYISGDEAELERRRYYNSKNNGYDVYVRMFQVAYKLSQSDRYYSTRAAVFLHYFTGLALRLKIPVTENPKPLVEQAMAEQKKALELEAYAAYIYNELGILYQLKKNYSEAEKNYTRATQLSPQWALPQSNLSGLYIAQQAFDKAGRHADMADSLQGNLQSISINRGLINEKKGNLLFAEEDYRHAIDINSRHFLPFERLGYVYTLTADYALADSFFYEADLRKKGYHFKANGWGDIQAHVPILPAPFVPCTIDSSVLEPTDVFAFFTWGVQEYLEKKYNNAIRILRKVVAVEPTNPLVYHYMGKAYYDEQKWEQAAYMFGRAIMFSKNPDEFELYVDSVTRSKKYSYDHECFEKFFRDRFYRQTEDYFFAGTIHENWKHFEEAEHFFRQIIKFEGNKKSELTAIQMPDGDRVDMSDYDKTAAYAKLWQLLEKLGRYHQAEDEIKNFKAINRLQSDEELNEFYRRMIGRFPENGDWPYRLGTLLYQYAPFKNRVNYFDSVIYFPFLNKELFVDFELYPRLYGNDSLAVFDETETGEPRRVLIRDDMLKKNNRTYFIPGTREYIPAADLIFMPRKDGITFLQYAADLIAEKEALADIHFKTGNIYLWSGSKKMAAPYFEKSLLLAPQNANTRLTLVDIYNALYKNRAAYRQLTYLSDSNQINTPKRILFSRFSIWAGNFAKAEESLRKTESYVPFKSPDINNMRGLAAMLAGKYKQAIAFYEKSYQAKETDTEWFNTYSLARLYASTGNTAQAWKYLQYAIDFGFNFSYVLQNDSYMKSLRNSPRWKTMMAGIAIKKYKNNKPVN